MHRRRRRCSSNRLYPVFFFCRRCRCLCHCLRLGFVIVLLVIVPFVIVVVVVIVPIAVVPVVVVVIVALSRLAVDVVVARSLCTDQQITSGRQLVSVKTKILAGQSVTRTHSDAHAQ